MPTRRQSDSLAMTPDRASLGGPNRRLAILPGGTILLVLAALMLSPVGGAVGVPSHAPGQPTITSLPIAHSRSTLPLSAAGSNATAALPSGHPLSSPAVRPASGTGGASPSWSSTSGAHPYAWGTSGAPPGAEALGSAVQHGSAAPSSLAPRPRPSDDWGPNTSAPDGDCYGIWPTVGGQSTYANDCYGHDEPGIDFYSTLPGSGGNVTWNVTLPTSLGGYGYAQSDLYTAIWFGMTFSDSFAWEDQCFLELQFYPDSSWTTSSADYGNWVGAAVAWQIEAASGYEDACFYQPLTLDGSGNGSYFNMNQGDQITVAMTGWIGDRYGENLTITDVTTGDTSSVNFYDYSQSLPLNPGYSQNDWPNALQWTPGGELPVVFAFETGHTSYPYPNNNSYGGCSAGVPPPTAADPAVPCPSYDPASWVNDTLTPWKIATPTFSDGVTTETPTQVSFTQDLGGIAFIDPVSNYTCVGRDGSAWCSYPWYSYYCPDHTFEFGATDYPGVSDDFGGFDEYAQYYQLDAQQFGFYPPTNFSIPACGAPAYSVTVGSANPTLGSAYFLSQPIGSPADYPGLAAGEYALAAIPAGGASFQGWTVTGSVTVDASESPSTTLWVSGDGTVSARFVSTAANTTTVTFDESPTSGSATILSGLLYSDGVPLATLSNGGSVDVAPGIYSIQAYPVPGYNFSHWTVTGDGALLAAPYLPFTWLYVPSTAAGVTVKAFAVTSSSTDFVYYGTYGSGGKVSFDGGTATTFNYASVSVGTYSLVATPSAGYTFGGWVTGSSAVLCDYEATTNVTLENGTTYYLDAYFNAAPASLTLTGSPVAGGGISLNDAAPVDNVTSVLSPGFYAVVAVPDPGYSFTGWAVSSPADLWIYNSLQGFFWLEVNASATLTANFTSASALTLSFAVSPASAGQIQFSFQNYANGDENTTAAAGLYEIAGLPAAGWVLSGWGASGGVSLPTYVGFANLTSSGGVLTATFTRALYPVTFLANAAAGASFLVNGTTVPNGANAWVPSGGVAVSFVLPVGPTFAGWAGSPGVSVSGGQNGTLFATGPGTVMALAIGFSAVGGILPRSTIDLGTTVLISVAATGVGPFSYTWSGVPPGCSAGANSSFSCTPNATGEFNVSVLVAGPQSESVNLAVGTLTVVSPLTVSAISVAPANLTIGESTVISITVSGGQLPTTIVYAGIPSGCAAANVTEFTCQPNSTGLFDLEATVSDATGFTRYGSGTLAVNPLPTFTAFAVNRSVVDVGLPATFADSVSGGTGTITLSYAGLPSGCASADVHSLSCTPTAAGTYQVVAIATDAHGFSANATLALTVNPLPTVSGFLASVATAIVNNTTVKFVVAISGGTGPYRVSYTGLPPGCFSSNSTQLNCLPRATGSYTVTAHVIDALGQGTSAELNLTVENATAPPPVGGGGGGGSAGWSTFDSLALVAVAIVVVGAIALYATRRRGPPPSNELEAGPAPPALEDGSGPKP